MVWIFDKKNPNSISSSLKLSIVQHSEHSYFEAVNSNINAMIFDYE